ncbi:nuclear transport factor 2 family protein [Streptomyces sp. NPDC051985]|uniref:nuclear transport factor 2 family protein n=1 Tax=Streptomyces sp. NPDC051985 TaxID=3155807 RepID=UPI00343D0721
MEPFVALIRRYVVDYTNRHDTGVCPDLMVPGYTLRMGPHVLAGRDELYIPAARRQFTQFPGLCLTVHEIVTDGDRLAMRFSEHGASARHAGARASWQGIGLYRWNGRQLIENAVEQDYQARRRQLSEGTPDPVGAPAVAPWETTAQPADPVAEQVVRDWIAAGTPGSSVRVDDGDTAVLQTDVSSTVDDLFSAGPSVAFRVTLTGRYAGGLDGVDRALAGNPSTLHMVGIVRVDGGRVTQGQIVRGRLDMARGLTTVAA